MDQEQIQLIQIMEQEVNHLNEQLRLIDQNVVELKGLIESLNEIEGKDAQEILVNIGKKIYLPVTIQNKELIVDIGKNSLVKKNIPDTKRLIEEQLGKLSEGKRQVFERLEDLHKEMERMIAEIEKSAK
ncbi:prefoldin subunit alpha [Candidatus Pacearchaeota archaeon]|nr:prefoldin subunit alpha [Candidatus Pacearchaeota archaeon]